MRLTKGRGFLLSMPRAATKAKPRTKYEGRLTKPKPPMSLAPVEGKPEFQRTRPPSKHPSSNTLGWAFSHLADGLNDAIELFEQTIKDHEFEGETEHVEEAKVLVEKYHSTPLDKRYPLLLDDLCRELRFKPEVFFAWVMERAFAFVAQTRDFLQMLYYPQVLEASFKSAIAEKGGFKDRNAILQQTGDHFAPRGASINIDNRRQTLNVEDRGLPDFDETVNELHEVLRGDLQSAPLPALIEGGKENG